MNNDANTLDFTDVVERFDELGTALFGDDGSPTDFAEKFIDLEHEKTPQEAFKHLKAAMCRYLTALESKLNDKDREIEELRRGLKHAEENLKPLMILASFASFVGGAWIAYRLDLVWLGILFVILVISSSYWFHRKKS